MDEFFGDFADFIHDQESSEFMTRGLARMLLGKNRKDFQANTTFSKRNTKWWEASFYRIEHGIPVFVPTNLPRVSHLDLEQHFHSFPEETLVLIDLVTWADESLRDVKRDPLVDATPRRRDLERLEKTLYYMEVTHYNLVKYTLNFEYHECVYKNLKAHWDVTKFKRFVDFCLGQTFLGPEIQRKAAMIIDLLMIHCIDDSALVVQVLADICKRFQADDLLFLDLLPSDLVKFCGKHLKRVGADFNDFFEEWFISEDPLIHAICDGAPWKVKTLVEWEFPSALLPFAVTPSVAQLMKGAWPREKDGVELQSYNSLEYFSMFTTFLTNCILTAMGVWFGFSKLRTGFRTFWQSVPTPHIPFVDMSAFLHRMSDCYPERLPFVVDEFEEILDILKRLLTEEEEYCHYVYAPRSLQHLCRFAIRRLCPTPERIAVLPVADNLKPYLCLDIPPSNIVTLSQ